MQDAQLQIVSSKKIKLHDLWLAFNKKHRTLAVMNSISICYVFGMHV